MPLTFSASTTAADRVVAELLAVPVGIAPAAAASATAKGKAARDAAPERVLGPGADVVDAALGGGLVAFLDEAGFEGKLGEAIAVPTNGNFRAKAAIIVGIGDPAELTADSLRRAGASIAASRDQGGVARDHAGRGSRHVGARRRRGSAGGGRRPCPRRVPVPRLQAEGHTVEVAEGHAARQRDRRCEGCLGPRRGDHRCGVLGARSGQHAVEGQGAGRRRQRGSRADAAVVA